MATIGDALMIKLVTEADHIFPPDSRARPALIPRHTSNTMP